MGTEAKAKVVAYTVFGAQNLLNSTISSKSTEAKQLTRQKIEHILPAKQTRLPLPLLLSPSFFYGWGETLFDKISLYVTDDTIPKLNVT